MRTEGLKDPATKTEIPLTHREGIDSNTGKSEKHVTHYGAELNVYADRREQTADVLWANYSTARSAKSQAKRVSVVMTCDKGNLMGITLAGVKYIYVYGDTS
jgi:hypothetical protein